MVRNIFLMYSRKPVSPSCKLLFVLGIRFSLFHPLEGLCFTFRYQLHPSHGKLPILNFPLSMVSFENSWTTLSLVRICSDLCTLLLDKVSSRFVCRWNAEKSNINLVSTLGKKSRLLIHEFCQYGGFDLWF